MLKSYLVLEASYPMLALEASYPRSRYPRVPARVADLEHVQPIARDSQNHHCSLVLYVRELASQLASPRFAFDVLHQKGRFRI